MCKLILTLLIVILLLFLLLFYVAIIVSLFFQALSLKRQLFFINKLMLDFNILIKGRYSPVRRASEGSRNPQIQGPFQECQQLQKGLAQQRNNYLVTPSPPQENSVSLPGEFDF